METACSPTGDRLCGRCLPGFYELRSMTGEAELLCLPCNIRDTVHEECLRFSSKSSETQSLVSSPERSIKDPPEKEVRDENLSVVLTGAAVASLVFLISLLLWVVLLTAERFKQVPEDHSKPEGLLSAANLQYEPLSGHSENTTPHPDIPTETASTEEPRGQSSVNHESELHPTSIVINVTTNIKPCSQKTDSITQEGRRSFTTEEMEHKLQKIWEIAQGQSIETLDYDSVQDLSLLLDSPDNMHTLRKLGLSLGVPPQVTAHLHSFRDLFQYLRTSTYTQLPQLAQAAALLPSFELVSRIHKAVVNN
ncbi:uncharacterized protein LOC108231242 isoform X2 [Kryptolebias marmoratus]|nr:uncharacterized protein LOC108231242 isoform X2 [Kryptolebias marmoratus]XP_037833500.1 uncharacterized protein LOC108231242 isoform X2 [Kryptolebias marmoratus]